MISGSSNEANIDDTVVAQDLKDKHDDVSDLSYCYLTTKMKNKDKTCDNCMDC